MLNLFWFFSASVLVSDCSKHCHGVTTKKINNRVKAKIWFLPFAITHPTTINHTNKKKKKPQKPVIPLSNPIANIVSFTATTQNTWVSLKQTCWPQICQAYHWTEDRRKSNSLAPPTPVAAVILKSIRLNSWETQSPTGLVTSQNSHKLTSTPWETCRTTARTPLATIVLLDLCWDWDLLWGPIGSCRPLLCSWGFAWRIPCFKKKKKTWKLWSKQCSHDQIFELWGLNYLLLTFNTIGSLQAHQPILTPIDVACPDRASLWPVSLVELLECWKGRFANHNNGDIWRAVPAYLMLGGT